MKAILIILLTAFCMNVSAQTKKKAGSLNQRKTTLNTTSAGKSVNGQTNSNTPVQPQQTATDRYLNGPVRAGQSPAASGASQSAADKSPFVGGIHAADNASKTFDTTAAHRSTANNSTLGVTTTVRNDTAFNVNTISQGGGVTTNSGAVDKSGQAQFGQTNWGDSRSTVGESQWTIPPPVTASFNKEFSSANDATWTRNNTDTTLYSARYKSGTQWVTSNYNAAGQRLDMRTEFSLVQPPRAVSAYMARQPTGFEAVTIYQVQVQGKPDVYEIRSKTGATVYVNNDGVQVNY